MYLDTWHQIMLIQYLMTYMSTAVVLFRRVTPVMCGTATSQNAHVR